MSATVGPAGYAYPPARSVRIDGAGDLTAARQLGLHPSTQSRYPPGMVDRGYRTVTFHRHRHDYRDPLVVGIGDTLHRDEAGDLYKTSNEETA